MDLLHHGSPPLKYKVLTLTMVKTFVFLGENPTRGSVRADRSVSEGSTGLKCTVKVVIVEYSSSAS